MEQFKVLDRISEHGNTRIVIECPFCKCQSTAYVWSLRGSGKRCENKSCEAMFTGLGGAYLKPRIKHRAKAKGD